MGKRSKSSQPPEPAGQNVIPPDIQHFLLQKIDSIAQLEGLLLLRKTPDEIWTIEMVATRLYIDEAETRGLLLQLAGHGLIVRDKDTFHYQLSDPSQEELLGRLAEVYSQYLLPVTHLVHSKCQNRCQEFADAFKIRKE